MLNRLQIGALPPGPRWAAQWQVRVDGEDVVAEAVGEGGRGPLAHEILPADGPSLLWATERGRRVVLGEPECTGGCCGCLSVFVQRHGGIVEWSDWQVPDGEVRPSAFHFDAGQYDAEVARVSADRGRQADAGS
ncbi:hypothetical protein ACFUVV_00230 [Streptomyces sp. NPDC057376]|uniref:hypothetical protein n=1 Tax=unclassified Streptomyces TaxID=2593676 RepID=UPI00093D4612|nr:hypothetical protein [Streptomyces sp. CB02414]OKI77823.1 hypothetical protein AMK11_30895 [Streptomyces sp. CB02414]